MKPRSRMVVLSDVAVCFVASGLLMFGFPCLADDTPEHFVSLSGANIPPYTNWVHAATQIQSALDAAAAGDTVWVTNGPFVVTSPITLPGGVSMIGLNAATNTTIHGNYPNTMNSCLIMTNAGAIVNGFTITGGGGTFGGGVHMTAGLLKDCIVVGNRTSNSGNGGGVYMTGGAVKGCEITANRCFSAGSGGSGGGGGVYMTGADTMVTNSVIHSNTNTAPSAASNVGGGWRLYFKAASTSSIISTIS